MTEADPSELNSAGVRGDQRVCGDDARATLNAEKQRTGIGIRKLLAGRDDIPSGLNAKKVDNFLAGGVRTMSREHLDYLLSLWNNLPSGEFVTLTPEVLKDLRRHIRRSGKGPHAILRAARNKPDGLTSRVIESWLGPTAKARKDHLEYVFSLYESPAKFGVAMAASTPEIQARMRSERARTGVGVKRLLNGRNDVPDGLNVHRAANFYKGQIREMPREHLEYILSLWGSLPTRAMVKLTPAIVARLRDHMERTGKGRHAILRGARDKPDGLNSGVIRGWLDGIGAARKDHLDYVFARYEKPGDRTPLTPQLRAEIGRHIRRTGVTPQTLAAAQGVSLDGFSGDWRQWPPRLMPEADVERMLEGWRELPDRFRRG